jgi:hypothetical protein
MNTSQRLIAGGVSSVQGSFDSGRGWERNKSKSYSMSLECHVVERRIEHRTGDKVSWTLRLVILTEGERCSFYTHVFTRAKHLLSNIERVTQTEENPTQCFGSNNTRKTKREHENSVPLCWSYVFIPHILVLLPPM